MAMIVAKINTITGESETTGYIGQVPGIGITESVVSSASNADGNRLQELEIIRYKDSASPKLAEACAAGTSLGQVVVRLLQDFDGEIKTLMSVQLENTFVKRIHQETLDNANLAYQSGGLASAQQGLALSGGLGDREIERVVFNSTEVIWSVTKYATDGTSQGTTSRGYNIQKSQAATATAVS